MLEQIQNINTLENLIKNKNEFIENYEDNEDVTVYFNETNKNEFCSLIICIIGNTIGVGLISVIQKSFKYPVLGGYFGFIIYYFYLKLSNKKVIFTKDEEKTI